MNIIDKHKVELTAALWDSIGLSKEAAHIRSHGISLAAGRMAKPTTAKTLEQYARAWIDYSERRARAIIKPTAIKQCAEESEMSESLIARIIAGRIPGVSAIKKQILLENQTTP